MRTASPCARHRDEAHRRRGRGQDDPGGGGEPAAIVSRAIVRVSVPLSALFAIIVFDSLETISPARRPDVPAWTLPAA